MITEHGVLMIQREENVLEIHKKEKKPSFIVLHIDGIEVPYNVLVLTRNQFYQLRS